jgi:hypothetical protein
LDNASGVDEDSSLLRCDTKSIVIFAEILDHFTASAARVQKRYLTDREDGGTKIPQNDNKHTRNERSLQSKTRKPSCSTFSFPKDFFPPEYVVTVYRQQI